MSGIELILLAMVGFILAVISGITGGGGGFIMTPLLIFFGLSPAQAVTTGKLGGLSMAIGSLRGMRGARKSNKKIVIIMSLFSIITGVLSTLLIPHISGDVYSTLIGVSLVVAAPVIYIKKVGHTAKEITQNGALLGYVGLFLMLLLQGLFSSGIGVFVSLVMMVGLGLDSLQANISKRITQVVLNSVIIIGLFSSGLIIWEAGIVLIAVNLVGSYVGGKIAVKKGAAFVSKIIAALALVSGLALLVS